MKKITPPARSLALVAASASLLFVAACATSTVSPVASSEATRKPGTESGTGGIASNPSAVAPRAQDDFYGYVNEKWLKTVDIPPSKSRWGSFDELREDSLTQLRSIIDTSAKNPDRVPGSDQQKIVDLFASFMDQSRRNAVGDQPLQPVLARISALQDKNGLPALMAELNRIGVNVPVELSVNQDGRDATRYAVVLVQSGLGLPDRDYYLKDDDVRLKAARSSYQALIEETLRRQGDNNAAENARAILALETGIARVQWTKVENRDPVKSYNKLSIPALETLVPAFDWNSYRQATGIADRTDYVLVRQPSYLSGFGKLVEATPLSVWKAYFRWQVLSRYAPFMTDADVNRHFAFFETVLRGVPVNEPQWQRGVRLVEYGTGEILGKLYVEKHFPPASKARMQTLVANLLEAYRQSIDTLDWMSPATRKEAQAKLATFSPKIGYPDKWRDYSTLSIDKNDLVGNVQRIGMFNFARQLAKLGKPIDRTEWGMTPQTVNAYYNPQKNEIVFPAAILQPPFFDANADDAVNYGGIGAVIGHEISHGFDDQGSQFDGLGNLRDWWTKEDHDKFAVKTRALVAQYDQFSPLPGYHVNGALTLGENIADNSGLSIASKAYHLSLHGKAAPVIDGLTGDQRLYRGWATVWRGKARDAQQIVLIKTDPHSPGQFRGNGTLRNQSGFYEAFGLKEGDKMYLTPEQRVSIW